MYRSCISWLGWLLLLFFLIACQGTDIPAAETADSPPATAPPVATTAPTATIVPPTAVPPTATATIAPTATSMPPTATATPLPAITGDPASLQLPAEGQFIVFGDQPIVPNGPKGAWDDQFTDPGAAVYYDGLFHMFHNGFVGWPAPVGITYSTSPDGYTWTRVTPDPVFSGEGYELEPIAVLASSVHVESDGTWVMYFYSWDDLSWPRSASSIGRATAPAPTGPWTAAALPVLVPGAAGEWDDTAVRSPSVVKVDDGYHMFYAGSSRNEAMIGMAVSSDGITWQKYDDPDTTMAPFSQSDPVFMASDDEGAWDQFVIMQPRVQLTPDGYVMLYSSNRSTSSTSSPKHGYAISPDGLEWFRSDAPVIQAADVSGGRAIWFTELLFAKETYFLFFELGKGGYTEVYLATHAGSLR